MDPAPAATPENVAPHLLASPPNPSPATVLSRGSSCPAETTVSSSKPSPEVGSVEEARVGDVPDAEAMEAARPESRAGGKGAWKARRSRITAVSAAVRCCSWVAACGEWNRGEGMSTELVGKEKGEERRTNVLEHEGSGGIRGYGRGRRSRGDGMRLEMVVRGPEGSRLVG